MDIVKPEVEIITKEMLDKAHTNFKVASNEYQRVKYAYLKQTDPELLSQKNREKALKSYYKRKAEKALEEAKALGIEAKALEAKALERKAMASDVVNKLVKSFNKTYIS